MNSTFSDEDCHSTDNVPIGQHENNDHFPQILEDLMKTNNHDHTTTTGGNYTVPDSLPPPLLKVNVFYMSNLKCQFTMVPQLAC